MFDLRSDARARAHRLLGTLLAGAFALASVGCGQLSIRTWITVVEEESEANVGFVGSDTVFPFSSIQGGFQIDIVLDTSTLDPITGDITINQVRLVGQGPGVVGKFCSWRSNAGPSGGTFSYDLFTGEANTEVQLTAFAQSEILEVVNTFPILLEQSLPLDLGGALDPAAFLGAISSGTTEGLFATSAVIQDQISLIPGFPAAIFTIDLALTNGPKPPLLSEQTMTYCGRWLWRNQGNLFFHGINPKSSFHLLNAGDEAVDPIVVRLSELDLEPGDPIGLKVIGTYAKGFSTVDGSETGVLGVFSSDGAVLGGNVQHRVPGAIDAGEDYVTPLSTHVECLFFPICWFVPTDIDEDFRIDSFVDGEAQELQLVVPPGAEYLILAPTDTNFEDNTGLGFGVQIRTALPPPFGF